MPLEDPESLIGPVKFFESLDLDPTDLFLDGHCQKEGKMNGDSIKHALAPCGLNCQKCFAHTDGDIRRYSQKLLEALGNFDDYAKRFETLLSEPVFRKYPDFRDMLEYLASENCEGCRNEQCKLFKTCGVRPCHQEKKVDFCCQCDAFPCDRTGFDPSLQSAWVQINEKIRSVGIERYYEQTKNRHRYPRR
jgi:hypothetical protein